MIRRTASLTWRIGALVVIALVVKRLLEAQRAPEPDPVLVSPQQQDPAVVTQAAEVDSWVAPVDGGCPPSHPIKAKLRSKVFRRPGMRGYETSRPDRCYESEGAARRDGFTEAQR